MRKSLRLYEPYRAPMRGGNAALRLQNNTVMAPSSETTAMVVRDCVVCWESPDQLCGTGAVGPAGPAGPIGPAGYGLSSETITNSEQGCSPFTTTTVISCTGDVPLVLPASDRNGAQKTLVYTINTGAHSCPVQGSFVSGGERHDTITFLTGSGVANLVFSSVLDAWVVLDTVAASLS